LAQSSCKNTQNHLLPVRAASMDAWLCVGRGRAALDTYLIVAALRAGVIFILTW
jgi:hypothetical protein